MGKRGRVVGVLAFVFAAVLAARAASGQNQPGTVTFNRDVAPVIFRHCASCHFPQGPGPFSLLTFDAARQRARQIAAVTASRYMPPWKPDPGSGNFVGAHRLTTEEIDLFQRWVTTGTLQGDAADLPPMPALPTGWQLGTPDLVVSLPAYRLPASGTDVFRIFVVPVRVPAARFVRGFEFRPNGSNLVHHANIRIDRTPGSRRLDDEDPAPGYDGLLSHSATYPDGHFLAWTPGQAAPLLPKGLAWKLEPTTDLVVELHLQPTGKEEIVQPSIGLYFGADPPERVPGMVRLGRQNIDIAPNQSRYLVTDAFVLPVPVEILALQPHAHYLAREVRGTAKLPDGSSRPLISISDWDFRWQQVYRYVTPVSLPAGTTIAMEYRYDNSAANPRNPLQPPQRVIWGQRSADEMGDLWIQVLTRNASDLDRLMSALRPKVLAEDIVGYEARLRAEPDSVALHDDVALLYLKQGLSEQAVAHFARSVALRPQSAAAHFNLGTALAFAGREDDALRRFQTALELRPDYVLAHNNLGAMMMRRGDLTRAQEHFEAAARLDPNNADAQQNLAILLRTLGRHDLAREHFLIAARLLAAAGNVTRAAALTEEARLLDFPR